METLDLKKIYRQAVNDIYVGGFDSYLNFLRFCGRGNLHSFDNYNQILIYSQKPRATYVNTLDVWEKQEKRISKRSKCITLVDDRFSNNLICAFDYADTISKEETVYFQRQWSFDHNTYEYFIEHTQGKNMEECVKNLTRTYVRDILDSEKLKNTYDMQLCANFIVECSMVTIMNRCNLKYQPNSVATSFYESINVRSYGDFFGEIGSIISRLADKTILSIGTYVMDYLNDQERSKINHENRQGQRRDHFGRMGENIETSDRRKTDGIGNAGTQIDDDIERRDREERGALRHSSSGLLSRKSSSDSNVDDGRGKNASIRTSESTGIQGFDVATGGPILEGQRKEEHDIYGNSSVEKQSEELRRRDSNERDSLSEPNVSTVATSESELENSLFDIESDENLLGQCDLIIIEHFIENSSFENFLGCLRSICMMKTTKEEDITVVKEICTQFIPKIMTDTDFNIHFEESGIRLIYVPNKILSECKQSEHTERILSYEKLYDYLQKQFKEKKLPKTGYVHKKDPEGFDEYINYFLDRYYRKTSYEESQKKYFAALQKRDSSITDPVFIGKTPDLSGQMELPIDDIQEQSKKLKADEKVVSDKQKQTEISNVTQSPGRNDQRASISVQPKEFYYNDDWMPNTGGDKTRFDQNINALHVLKLVESENRNATPEEQEILSKYVGWGGLANAFDKSKDSWSKEYEELKKILTDEEYESARSSVLDSFYTSKEIIEAVYAGIERMGFHGGNVLEPAMGIGNFFNGMPQNIAKKSNLYGVELDPISGRIAKLLHPKANIQICGFEKADLQDNMFDVVIGNVPFGDLRVNDSKYKKEKFYIHDYFFAKALDKVAAGGIVAMITSKGTLDKSNAKFRKYIAERAELMGAIRLPNTAFKESANTSVTSDILFFRKKYSPGIDKEEPDWISLSAELDNDTGESISYNEYFAKNKDMMLGTMIIDRSMFGNNSNYTGLKPFENIPLKDSLDKAIEKLPQNVLSVVEERNVEEGSIDPETIPAISSVKNNTYTVINDVVYHRENSVMYRVDEKPKTLERIKGLCAVRDQVRKLIAAQMDGCSDDVLTAEQNTLSVMYDEYVKKYGYIVSRSNRLAFSDDVDYALLSSLEVVNDDVITKADIFTKRTIKPYKKPDTAETAQDALVYSLNEYGSVDIPYMLELYPVKFDVLISDLKGEIFLNPEKASNEYKYIGWESKDQYLSGNVRRKLEIAKSYSSVDKRYNINVEALEKVQPKDLEPHEIYVRIGTTWINTKDYKEFIFELLDVPEYSKSTIDLNFDERSNTYFFSNKSSIRYLEKNKSQYGTGRIMAIEIMEKLLNQSEISIKDKIIDDDGSVHYEKNQPETLLALEKARILNEKFKTWIFDDFDRREEYTSYYNKTFNNMVLREYDGSNMVFPGMNPEFALQPYQKNAVARIVRGGSTLLGHCVGAGKSFEMIAAAMELKRLNLANKPLIIVPNGLVGQMAGEFLKLYPAAEVLVTTKKDFQKDNRRRFISKIATGDYDAVIMGQSQFEKIPVSKERQKAYLENEVHEILECMEDLKRNNADNWTVKMMEREKKKLTSQIEDLKRDEYKDDVITFEELGVDALFIDEAHYYKNLSFSTKMTRVAGINPAGAKKCMDLFLKREFLYEKNPGRNLIFATGTPISNTMCEMYTMMKYLEPDVLRDAKVYHFDAWAANFGETVTAMELTPEGNGYRQKTSFSHFTNLPELLKMFKRVADIVTPDMINIKIPKLVDDKYNIVESEPNADVKAYMKDMVHRADLVHAGSVNPQDDNMLKICNDGRLLATDIRLIDPTRENDPDSKLNKCIDNIYKIYMDTMEKRSVQAVCCDIGTPSTDSFNVYDYIKDNLVEKGIPKDEVCFIHDATTDKKRETMLDDLRKGNKRIIIGSTVKMGTGTNIQNKLIAMHEIDCPWRPSDVEQREGRILRQLNENDRVYIFRYVTKGTFDAYNWSIIEKKQGFIGQIMKGNVMSRSCEDIDETKMSYAEMKAVASGNPLIKERSDVENELQRIHSLKNSYNQNRYRLERNIKSVYPKEIDRLKKKETLIQKDILIRDSNVLQDDEFQMIIQGKVFNELEPAATLFTELAASVKNDGEKHEIGEYAGFTIYAMKNWSFNGVDHIVVSGNYDYTFDLSTKPTGNIQKMRNVLKKLDQVLQNTIQSRNSIEKNLEDAKIEYEKNFEYEDKYEKLVARMEELDFLLSQDDKLEEEEKENIIEEKKALGCNIRKKAACR